jgi:serine/threonine protein kinase
MHKQNIMHRDLKLQNILLHFPDNNLLEMKKKEKMEFLKKVNLT